MVIHDEINAYLRSTMAHLRRLGNLSRGSWDGAKIWYEVELARSNEMAFT